VAGGASGGGGENGVAAGGLGIGFHGASWPKANYGLAARGNGVASALATQPAAEMCS